MAGTELTATLDSPAIPVAGDDDIIYNQGVVTCTSSDIKVSAEEFRDAIAQHRH